MEKFVIKTISTFEHKYIIEALTKEDAILEFYQNNEAPNYIEEVSQVHVGEIVEEAYSATDEEINETVDEYLQDRWTELVREVKYLFT